MIPNNQRINPNVDDDHYVTLDFNSKMMNGQNEEEPSSKTNLQIMPPPRLHHHHHRKSSQSSLKPSPAINHHLHIHHPTTNNLEQTNQSQPVTAHQEDPRDFAAFLCIFATVMTTVLVLMFYIVGEQAFRLILLVITFVFILTLCMACFLRRPTLVILGQTISNGVTNNGCIDHNNNIVPNGKPSTQQPSTPQPYLLIFPTLFGPNTNTTTSTVEH